MNFNFQMTSYRITNGGSRGSYSLYLWNYLKADLKTELFSFLFSSFYLVLPGLLFQGRFSTDPPTALAFSSSFFFFSVVLLRCPHTHTHLGPRAVVDIGTASPSSSMLAFSFSFYFFFLLPMLSRRSPPHWKPKKNPIKTQ